MNGEDAFVELDGEATDGDGGSGDGQGGAEGERTGGGKGGRKKNKFSAFDDAEEDEDLGLGEMAKPQSALGKLLMQDGRVELTVGMASAAKELSL